MEITERFLKVVGTLNHIQITLLLEMARAMTVTIEEYTSETSDLVSTEFATHFANRLVMHHATHAEKFGKKAFEYAFVQALHAAGKQASIMCP